MAVEIKENTCFNSDLTDTWSRNLPLRSITFGTNTINFGPKTIDALFTTSESSNIEGDIMPFLLLRSHGQQCISESPANISSILVAFLSKVEEIKQIYLCKESETLYRIWSIVDEDTDQTREKIYEKEMNLIRYFGDALYMDFTIDTASDADYIKNAEPICILNRE